MSITSSEEMVCSCVQCCVRDVVRHSMHLLALSCHRFSPAGSRSSPSLAAAFSGGGEEGER